MNGLRRRILLWSILLVGALALGSQAKRLWPRENRIVIRLPSSPVRRVKLDLVDENDEALRTVELFPRNEQRRELVYVVSVPAGDYRLNVDYEFGARSSVEKNSAVGFTRVGVQHQIRLEGEEYRFPPPEETR